MAPEPVKAFVSDIVAKNHPNENGRLVVRERKATSASLEEPTSHGIKT
jgi:hypothetical protein